MKTNQLVEVRNGGAVTTSLQIAKIFGKNHFDILKAIRNLECSKKFIDSNFTVYHYFSKLNENVSRKLPMYHITRDGFTFLVMGFTGKVAAQFKEDYINAFNKMEQKLLEIQKSGLVSMESYKQLEQLNLRYLDMTVNSARIGEKLANQLSDIRNDRLKEVENRVSNQATNVLCPEKFYHLTDAYYNLIVDSFKLWLKCENIGIYCQEARDKKLLERLKASRLLFRKEKARIPRELKVV